MILFQYGNANNNITDCCQIEVILHSFNPRTEASPATTLAATCSLIN